MKRKKVKKIAFVVFVGIFFFSISGIWFIWERFINSPAAVASQEIIYEVEPKLSFKAVAKDLEKKGIVKNSELFVILGKVRGAASRMKVGEYLLNKNMRPSEVLSILISGKSIEHKLTITEGLNIFDIAQLFEDQGLIKKEDFLALVQNKQFVKSLLNEDQESLEGYLFPETYKITKYTETKAVLAEMVKKFQAIYKEVEPASKLTSWTRHQIVTLASIIEKETGAPQERPIIASVFHNRIQKKMLLQTDPTILYGKAVEAGRFTLSITRADILKPTKYNTYVIRGLPPGPISNPSKEALLATVNPAHSNYLFFVSHNDGTHEFSENYKQHNQAVKKYQLDARARDGKSWRDLKKIDKK